MSAALAKFGRFLIACLRDKAIDNYLMLRGGRATAQSVQELQKAFAGFTPQQKAVVDGIIARMLELQLHDVLFSFQDSYDRDLGIHLLVDGKEIARESGMLHGEPLGDDGWVSRYSRYPHFPKV